MEIPRQSTRGPGRKNPENRRTPAAGKPLDLRGTRRAAHQEQRPVVPAELAAPAPAMPTPVAAQPMFTSPLASAPQIPQFNAGAAAGPEAGDSSVVFPVSPPSPPAAIPQGPPDPLVEAPDAVWYVRPPSGGQYGPAAAPVMRTWIHEGRVSGDSLVWREGWRDWQEASGVFPQLRPQQATDSHPSAGTSTPLSTAEASIAARNAARRRSQRIQWLVIGLLGLAVIALGGVFAWVVLSEPPPQPGPATSRLAPASLPVALVQAFLPSP